MTGHATTPISTVLADALTEGGEALVSRVPRALGGEAHAVHRARVSSRRLREALAVVAAMARKTDAERLRRDARRVTRALGPVRELDVALRELDEAASRHGWSADLVAAVHRRLGKERDRRRVRMRAQLHHLDVERFERGCRNLAADLGEVVTEREWLRAVGERATRAAGRAQEALARCGTLYAPERLHAVRIAVKKLRYALELAAAAPGVAARDALELLRSTQERFGHLHDLQILLGEVEATASAARRGAMAAGLREVVEDLERDCRGVHALALAGFPALKTCFADIRRGVHVAARRPRLRMARVTTPAGRRPPVRADRGTR